MSFHHAPFGQGLPGDRKSTDNVSDWAKPRPQSGQKSGQNRVDLGQADDDETRFELLSAYLDGEVTSQERQQVAQWLMNDPGTLQMYRQLLLLRQAIRTAPVPTSPLQVPTPPQPFAALLSWKAVRRTAFVAIALALLGSLSQLHAFSSRQQLDKTWQVIRALPPITFVAPEPNMLPGEGPGFCLASVFGR